MISEVDIRDWDRRIEKAKEALESLDDFSRMQVGVNPVEPYNALMHFITGVEKLVHKENKQIPALFKAPR